MQAMLHSKFFKLGFSSTWNENFQMYKLGFREAEEPEIKLPKFVGSERKQEFQKNNCFIDYKETFDCEDHNQLWKILKRMGIPDHLTYLLRNLYAGQEATWEPYTEQVTDWKLGKEYIKAAYCHPAYLSSMQHKLESRLLGEISTTSDMQMIPL